MRHLFFLSTILSLTLLVSFSSSKKPSFKNALKVLEGFCNYVPSGNAVYDGDTISVQSFYMSETEITNFQYLEFLHYLKKNGRTEDYEIAQIDSLNWRQKNTLCSKYEEYYHRHPAYRDYPVVNISKEGAEMYCEWLSEVYDSLSGGELKLKFRIPSRAEYIRAARGDNHDQLYSWKGYTLFKTEGKSHFIGQVQANCIRNGAECITRNQETGELEFIHTTYPKVATAEFNDILAPAKSYWPNDFGFYNMNGNVSEMISDSDHAVGGDWRSPGYDIRCESIRPFKKAETTTGFRVVASYLESEK